jgi:uncharacterized membrane protein
VDHTGNTHGFLLSEKHFSTIDYPGALITIARGINNKGDIVGSYPVDPTLPGGGNHGLLLRRGVFTSVDFPGHLNTIAQRITASGQILGCYHDYGFMASMHGIVVSDGDYRALDGSYHGLNVPASMTNGATPDAAVIAGLYSDMKAHTHGYIVRRGNFASFDFPGGTSTQAWDIAASGEVVGFYSDSAQNTHGFLLSQRECSPTDDPGWCVSDIREADQGNQGDSDSSENHFVSFDYPGAVLTRAFGINSQGDVVGHYADSAGNLHAFLLSRSPQH